MARAETSESAYLDFVSALQGRMMLSKTVSTISSDSLRGKARGLDHFFDEVGLCHGCVCSSRHTLFAPSRAEVMLHARPASRLPERRSKLIPYH